MKYILVIGDGMADHPLDTLGGRTPLEASKKDAIDALARHGILGSVRNVPEGFAPGSDTAIMSIFGCSPRKYFFGRAPLEAAASGIRLAPGDACYRCNMVTYADEDVPFEHKHIISHSAGSIEGRESDELVTMLFNHPDFRPLAEQAGMVIHKGSSFRHLAVQSHVDIKGIKLAPPHDHLGEEIGPILPTGCPNADVLRELMRRAFDILDQHPINVARRAAGKLPANGVWFWAEGTAAALPNFPEHYGSDGGVVSAVPLCHGIGILTGLEAVTVPTATGEWDTDYAAKVAAALGVLKKHDFVALHLEGPDEATHNHDLEHKIYSIERLSADVVAPVTEALRAVIKFGFEEMNLNRIEAQHETTNPASGRVMEKVGMKKEGVLRQRLRNKGKFVDVALYSVLRGERSARMRSRSECVSVLAIKGQPSLSD